MKYFYLFLVLVVINENESLKTENYCRKDFKSKCKTATGISFECGKSFCSTDHKSCEELISVGKNSIKFSKATHFIYQKMIQSIQNCEIKEIRNQWSHRLNFG